MTRSSSLARFAPSKRVAQAGSAMLTSLLTVLVLSMVAANVLSSISSRYSSAYRSASWNDALLAANTGISVTLASLTSLIPNVSVSPPTGVGIGYTPLTQLPALPGLQLSPTGLLSGALNPDGTIKLLTLTPSALTHAGEGGAVQQSAVSLQVETLNDLVAGGATGLLSNVNGLLTGNNLQLIHLVSTGTVDTSGGRISNGTRLDNDLWRASLVTDRLTGAAAPKPVVSRQIDVVLRPVRPYEAAVVSGDALLASNKNTVFDSFNSLLLTANTGGQYDSQKRLSHGSVRANGANVSLGGIVYGDAGSNGGTLVKDSHVTGVVSNASYTPLPVINAPTWSSNSALAPASVTGNTTLSSVVITNLLTFQSIAAQYRFTGISGTLNITGVPGTTVEIYVDGDLTGGLNIAPGVLAKVYVSGSINTNTSKLKNGSNLASNLQIYGVYKDATSTPTIRLNADAGLAAAIYAPGHPVYMTGSADISGSITGARFEATDGLRVHYDEALAYNVGPLLRYGIASWKEITPSTN